MKLEMLGIKALLKILAAAIATWAFVFALTGQSLAGPSCARAQDSLALRAAAVQQKLMVAALYCQDVGRYNRFVISYQEELRASDAALMQYFRRSGTGDAGYHAYKTRLANAFSMAGIRGQEQFCEAARAVFAAASESQSLATLVSALPDARIGERNDCDDIREASNQAPAGDKPGIAAAGMGGALVRP